MAFMTAYGFVGQNNAKLVEYNDSRDYEHQTAMTFALGATGSETASVTVPLTNLNAGEVVLAVKSDQRLSARIVDSVNTIDATLQFNRFLMVTLRGLTGLTLTNLAAVEAAVTVVLGDE